MAAAQRDELFGVEEYRAISVVPHSMMHNGCRLYGLRFQADFAQRLL